MEMARGDKIYCGSRSADTGARGISPLCKVWLSRHLISQGAQSVIDVDLGIA
jgi:hypothetical protein